jgi:maltose alpha-D-glucosyltransferase/alpha-amylase
VTAIDVEALVLQRWFGAKDRTVRDHHLVDHTLADSPVDIELVELDYVSGPPDTYLVLPDAGFWDAFGQPAQALALLRLVRANAELATERGGRVRLRRAAALDDRPFELDAVRPLGVEQSNSSLRYGHDLILKLFRRQEPGVQPELEIGRFLAERTSFRHAPPLAGSIDYLAPDGSVSSLGVLQRFVPNRGDAWRTTLDRLARVLGGEALGPAIAPMVRLGEVTAELHAALASRPDDPAFAPEPIDAADVAGWQRGVNDEVARAHAALGDAAPANAGEPAAAGIARLLGSDKTRVHGDYHLGQVLETNDGDFIVIDFEGEPAKPLSARRARQSPLRDLAGLLRSLDYARHAALRACAVEGAAPARRAAEWHAQVRARTIDRYLATLRRVAPRALLPADDADALAGLEAFEREKAAYEVLYELNHRPDWLPIPLAALSRGAAP